jgi:hypothetical protein
MSSSYLPSGFEWIVPEPPDTPETPEGDPEASLQSRALQYINVSDVLHEVCELLLDDDLGSPLVQQLECWLSDPMTAIDPKHLRMHDFYGAVGRHVLGLAAAVLERKIHTAAGRLGNVAF